MKGTWNERTQQYDKSNYSSTPHDNLEWPKPGDIPTSSNSESILIAMARVTRSAAPQTLYAKHLDAVRKQAADAAVAELLKRFTDAAS